MRRGEERKGEGKKGERTREVYSTVFTGGNLVVYKGLICTIYVSLAPSLSLNRT